MTVEILEDGGVKIVASPYELSMLAGNLRAAMRCGQVRAPFLMDDGVSEFVIEVESNRRGPSSWPIGSAS